ncbi:hypothetical protein CAEBREN_07642 [Caenorhabditis brenneri]|uniref:SPK domain-containing protein n=1 Tax=Caenorhabditis brenneri TaxID=135651 RepID=G0NQW6_CAEBE|nr:hypothetical protein CAEBREN_07642 [Caenorhabditis brenneri]
MRTLNTEFAAVSGNEEAYHRNIYNSIKAKLKRKNILEKFTIPQVAHIHFLLSIPVDEKIKSLIEVCGKLVLDSDGHRVNFFKSFDGKVWSGVHRKWHGKSKMVFLGSCFGGNSQKSRLRKSC